MWASSEVLLRTEGDEEERREAVEAAKALLEAEGFPDHLLQALGGCERVFGAGAAEPLGAADGGARGGG